MNGYYNEAIAILKKNGYSLWRQGKGSHELWSKGKGARVSVPSNLKGRYLANEILKQAGINERIKKSSWL